MRKLSLLAAAAMVAGGSAFAMDGGGVSISGEANFGVKFKENDGGANAPNELQFHHEFDIKFSASGTTDGGIGFGGSVSIDNTESVSGSEVNAGDAPKETKHFTTAASRLGRYVALAASDNAGVVTVGGDGKLTVADGSADNVGEFDISSDARSAGDVIYVENGKLIILENDAATDAIIADGDTFNDGTWVANIVTVNGTPTTTLYKVKAGVGPMTAAGAAKLDPDASHKVDNHGEVYISMDMHKLTIGSDLDAADKLAGGLTDPGFDGIGIDDEAERVWGKSAADVRYDGDFGVASVAISYGDNAGDAEWAAGFSFNVDPVTFGAGFDSNNVMSIGMGFTQGQISMNALYSTDSDHNENDNEAKTIEVGDENLAPQTWKRSAMPDLKNQAMGVDMTYQMSDATSIVLVAAQHKKESANNYWKTTGSGDSLDVDITEQTWTKSSTTIDAFGVGFSHDLGGGATLKAGAGSVDSDAVADLGITMKF